MIQTYTFTGTGRQIDAHGVFFRYESGTDGSGVTAIRVLADGAILGTFEPGDTIDLPTPAKRWEIYPTSAGCIGSVRVGNARVSSNKLQGVVQIVDGAKSRTLSNLAFSGTGYQGALAGNAAQVQLMNKGTSGKNIIINEVSIYANSATAVMMGFTVTAFASVLSPGRSKRVYGADSTAGEIRAQNTPTPPTNPMRTWVLGVATMQSYRPSEPIYLVPGAALYVSTAGANGIDISMSADWWEEAA